MQGVEGAEEGAEDTAGSGVGGDDWRCCCANPYSLWSVTEEVVNLVNVKWDDAEALELLYHVMVLDRVECGAEVDEEDFDKDAR